MEFTFETDYNQKALTAMAKGLRKTVRRKHSRCTHIFGWVIVAFCLVPTLATMLNGDFILDFHSAFTIFGGTLLLVVILAEDWINGYFARKRMISGTERSTTIFNEENYQTTTGVTQGIWGYEVIQGIAESDEYFIFALNKTFAQVYDKSSISGGTVEEFRSFITGKTNIEIQRI